MLDNLEQLLPGAARPIAELVRAAPQLRLLVTSREPLRIDGEVELALPPLEERDGVTLFLERAHAVRPDLVDSPAIHELAAASTGFLSLREAARLDEPQTEP